jgi:hypothetical protein
MLAVLVMAPEIGAFTYLATGAMFVFVGLFELARFIFK